MFWLCSPRGWLYIYIYIYQDNEVIAEAPVGRCPKKNKKIQKKSKKNDHCDTFFFPIPLGVSSFLHIFGGSLSGKPLLAHQLSMAKSRVTTNPMYVGGAGGYSFYVRGGEQVIRQRKNNSNYGSGASRTYAQMIRRVKWGNLVNVFKAMKSWQPKAYDGKRQGQTDYNIFMQLNINNATAALTREMCLSGCAVIEPLQVSRGSLPPIALALAGSGNQYVTDIVISDAIAGGTTVGELSTDILANNPQFQAGDNLAFCFFYNWKDSRVEWPFVATRYTEITLDTTSTVVVNSIPELDNKLSKSTGGFLQASWAAGTETSPNNEVGMVLIHTRKSASMLAVSSQDIVTNSNSLLSEYVGDAWYQTCIDTYGLTDEVPLDPNFKPGTIEKVTANGAVVSNGETLSGSQVIRIYGKSLYGQGYRFVHNGVSLQPGSSTDEYDEYSITDSGSYVIFVGDQVYMSFSVAAPSWPEGMSGRVSALIADAQGNVRSGSEESTDDGYLEYPQQIDSQYYRIVVYLYAKEDATIAQSDIQVLGNASATYTWNSALRYMSVYLTPAGAEFLVILKYKGFKFFQGNYSD